MASKYDPLGDYLAGREDDEVRLSLAEIEKIMGAPLPDSGRRYRPFWGNQRNTVNRPWARAWQTAGWRVDQVFEEAVGRGHEIVGVRFRRMGAPDAPVEVREPTTQAAAPVRQGPSSAAGREPPTTAARILIVSACSGRKAEKHPGHLTRADFSDTERLTTREAELAAFARPAVDMYTGREHCMVASAVRSLREVLGASAVGHVIVSAGYGVIAPERRIVPYDLSFKHLKPGEIRPWADHLGIPRDLQAAVTGWPLVVVALGTDYLNAIRPRKLLPASGQRIVYFVGASQSWRLPAASGVSWVDAGSAAAAAAGQDQYTFKGYLLGRLAVAVARDGAGLLDAIRGDSTNPILAAALGTR